MRATSWDLTRRSASAVIALPTICPIAGPLPPEPYTTCTVALPVYLPLGKQAAFMYFLATVRSPWTFLL